MKISNSRIRLFAIILIIGLGLFQFTNYYDYSIGNNLKDVINIVIIALLLVVLFVLYKRKALFFQSKRPTSIFFYVIAIIIFVLAIIFPNLYSDIKFKKALQGKEIIIKQNEGM